MATAKIGLVLDCTNPEPLAEFWAPALGYVSLGSDGNDVVLVDEANPRGWSWPTPTATSSVCV